MHRSYYKKQPSALVFVLKGLMLPYSEANIMLAFKPKLFFYELEKISRYKKRTLEAAYYRAQKQKLIERHANVVTLTNKGKETIQPFIAQHLPEGAKLMVIFDVPEERAVDRAKFRRVLKHWKFEQVQKSVWVTSLDHKQALKNIISELELDEFVQLYECSPV